MADARLVEVGTSREFQAWHRLQLPDGTPHEDGHAYRVEVTLRGGSIPPGGMLVDLDALGRAVEACVRPLDGARLDELSVFAGRPTTLEEVADHVRRTVAATLSRSAPGVESIRVTAFEADDAWATVESALQP